MIDRDDEFVASEYNNDWITSAEAAKIIKMSSRTIARLARQKKIIALKKGYLWLVSLRSLYYYLKIRRVGRPPKNAGIESAGREG